MKIRSLVLPSAAVLAAAGLLFSQTRPHTSQLRGPVTTDARVLAIVQGRVVLAQLGDGLQAQQVSGAWVITATSGGDYDAKLTRNADRSWPLPSGCTLRAVYRNGIRQALTEDYTVASGALRFTDGTSDPSLADDVVIAVCR